MRNKKLKNAVSLGFVCLGMLLLSTLCACGQRATFSPTFTISKKTTHKIDRKQSYTFGYLEVLENRNRPEGRVIKLPVYVFKSRNPNPPEDPIIYTVGGPGYSTMSSAQYMEYYKYLDDRDFILFEQRGSTYAEPHLDCPEWSQAVRSSNLPGFDELQKDSLLHDAARMCRKRLVNKGIDLNSYHTNAIAADIEDLRNVLGIKKYNLLTISYSTKIAQVLIRDYPNSVRSVVMDSALPLESRFDEESNQNLIEKVTQLLEDCASDSSCREAYPKLKSRFFEFLETISRTPLEIIVKNPVTKEEEKFYLKGEDIITVFSQVGTGGVSTIPLEMEKILQGDYSSIKEQLGHLFQPAGSGSGIGMRLSVWYVEEYPFLLQRKIEEERNKYAAIKGNVSSYLRCQYM